MNHFIIEMIRQIAKKKIPFYKFFNVVDTAKKYHLLTLWVEEFVLLYANDVTEDMIRLLSTELQYEKFQRYHFAGTKKVIEGLFATNQATYDVKKNRNIYRCDYVPPDFKYVTGELQMGSIEDLEEITAMTIAFSKEYKDPGKPIDLEAAMFQGIVKDNIYKWVDSNEICSILQVMYEDHDFPVIGNFYTYPKKRNKGYGASLINAVTKGLLEAGHEYCMLSTDATTPSSNRAFENAGYQKIGDYYLVYKNK